MVKQYQQGDPEPPPYRTPHLLYGLSLILLFLSIYWVFFI